MLFLHRKFNVYNFENAGEEAQNPRRTIPLAICFCLGVVFVAYSAMAAILTLIWPYYLQVCLLYTFVYTFKLTSM